MAIDGVSIAAVALELQGLANSRITKIYQPERREIIVHCRQPGASLPLVLSSDVQNARAHLATILPENPPSPPAFCMLLRKYLEGGRIVAIAQPSLERILEFSIENLGERGELTNYRLIVEMMGRHSNIILVNEFNIVLDAITRVDSRINRHREILPGVPYVLPPKQDKTYPMDLTWQTFLTRLAPAEPRARLTRLVLDSIGGIGPLTAKELVYRSGHDTASTRQDLDEAGLEALYKTIVDLAKSIEQGAHSPELLKDAEGKLIDVSAIALTHCPAEHRQTFDSISLALELFYGTRAAHSKMASAKANLSRVVGGHLRRVDRKLTIQKKALDQAEAADTHRIFGELLTSNLYRVEKGMESITVPNFYAPDQGEIEIPLDARLTPSGNAQAYFRRYDKAKKTKIAGQRQYNRTLREKKYLEQVQATIDLAQDSRDIKEIARELIEESYMKAKQADSRKRRPPAPSLPLRFRSQDGLDIYVGRNNRQNDHVTFKIGRPDDIWLHVKEIPGSHVIIKSHGGEIPSQTMEEAALLAAYYSKAQDGENVPVDYTLRKHVRKPRGARPGMVIYDHQRTLYVSPKPNTIEPIRARIVRD